MRFSKMTKPIIFFVAAREAKETLTLKVPQTEPLANFKKEKKVKKQKALDGTTEMTGGTAAVSSFSFETSGESPVAPCPNVARRRLLT